MTVLRTPRLILRRARPDDVDAMHAIFTDPRALQYWSHGPHEDVAVTQAWLASMIDAPAGESDDFVVTLDGRVIGKLGAWRLPEVGFLLHPDHWGRGYATEAMRAFLTHVFQSHRIDALTADVDPRNTASLKLLAGLGFVQTGRATGTWTTHIGLCDSIYLRLNREDWPSAG
jgi:RimJ/RimL family protein N-acetyltransferase